MEDFRGFHESKALNDTETPGYTNLAPATARHSSRALLQMEIS